MDKMYLIWSNEHGGWWLPKEKGYTDKKERAGIYSSKRAHEIVKDANKFIGDGDMPYEELVEFVR